MLKIKTLDEKRMEAIDVLRHTKKQQCRLELKQCISFDIEGLVHVYGYCAYGVLASEMFGVEPVWPGCPQNQIVYKTVREGLGLACEGDVVGADQIDLIALNDSEELPFEAIADRLEAHWFPTTALDSTIKQE